MDAESYGALTVVDIDSERAPEWFDLVTGAYAAAGDWAEFERHLAESAGPAFSAAVEVFLEYVTSHGGLDLVGRLVAGGSSLAETYAAAKAERGEYPDGYEESTEDTVADGQAGDDDSPGVVWQRLVEQFGPGWAGWDGSETGWGQFRDWTYTAANTVDPRMYALAYERLEPLGELPVAERIGWLTEAGFTVNDSAGETGKDGAADAEKPTLEDALTDAIDEALAELDGADELPDEVLAEIHAELYAELTAR